MIAIKMSKVDWGEITEEHYNELRETLENGPLRISNHLMTISDPPKLITYEDTGKLFHEENFYLMKEPPWLGEKVGHFYKNKSRGHFTEFQSAIHEWQEKTFPGATIFSKFHHLREEMWELEQEIIRYSDGEGAKPLKDELADCMLLLTGIASKAGIDIFDAMSDKLEINKKREWGEPDENGVVKHI